MAVQKVKFRKRSWESLVKTADPRPPKEVEYEFSNGRKFTKRTS